MTLRIAVTGPDGTGKTTLVRRLAARFEHDPGALRAFRSPQYHDDPDLPFGALSRAIEDLGQLADRLGDPRLKATMLFLAMTLHGDVERHVEAAWAPRLLVSERAALADSLTYARFYLPLLTGPLDAGAILPAALGADLEHALARVAAWLPVVSERLPDLPAPDGLWDAPLLVRALFDRPAADLVPLLQAAYHAALPDHIVLLTATPEVLKSRLAEKAREAGAAPRELHEQAQILAMFQAGLAESAAFLQTVKPTLRVTALDTSALGIEEAESALLRAIGVEQAG